MKKLFASLILSSFLFAVATHNILSLSWENTYCKFHPFKKECKIRAPYTYTHFTLHGLWPKKEYCKNNYKFKLSPIIKKVLEKYMPGAEYGLAKHEWIKHGKCFGSSANTYFLTSVKLTQQFNETLFINFLETHLGSFASLARIRYVLGSVFGKGDIRKFQLICRHGYITEIRINLKGNPVKEGLSMLVDHSNGFIGVKQCQGGIITAP